MTGPTPPRQVLTLDAVRRSIKELHKSSIHEQFLGYLHARACGIKQGTTTGITPDMSEISRLLAVPGGPANKPHFLPMSSRTKQDLSGHWLNPNIPGSFAPSSIRAASQFMRGTQTGKFDLPSDHVTRALTNHLNGTPRPVWPLAAYLLRNYSFDPDATGPQDLVDGFCEVFLFDSTDAGSDFDALFTTGDEPQIAWFEPLEDQAATTTGDAVDNEESTDD